MASDVSDSLRRFVAERAAYRSEGPVNRHRSPSMHCIEGSAFVSLFHPRRQRWSDHFVLRGTVIEPLTPDGKATARLLKLNIEKRLVERQLLAAAGRYPSLGPNVP